MVKQRKEDVTLLKPLLSKLLQMRKEEIRLPRGGGDRRETRRRREQATIEIQRGDSGFANAPLIEYTRSGARVVLNNATTGQSVDFLIKTTSGTVSGHGRVVWTSPLSNGRSVVGLELVRAK